MNRYFTEIAGNDALRARLGDEIRANTLSHAYIIEGPRGSGKHTLALHIAAALSCQRKSDTSEALPCLSCPSCKKILGGNSPDITVIGREDKATLGVEAIRKLKSDVMVAPNDTDVKVYLIEDAHLMTVQAQNAFLLTLEEPPKYVLFFLLCESAAQLLETIRSRAQILHTEPLSKKILEEQLCKKHVEARTLKATDPTEFSELLATADGKLGIAIELLSASARKPLIERRTVAKEFVRLCSESKSSSASLRYLNGLGQKRDILTAQLSTVLLCLRDLLVCKQTDDPPLSFFADAEEAHTMAYRFTTPELQRLCNAVTEAIDRLRVNANVRLTLTAMAVEAGLLRL
ncbi:MAG: hypothetical protein IJW16_06910 [Clostridia bacterium]|nr:hypothetical protein [Clostridia bacterium]